MSRFLCKKDEIMSKFFIMLGAIGATAHFAVHDSPEPRLSVQFGCRVSDIFRVIVIYI